jgi:DNA-binding CsgD family transcriptional regulator
MLDRFSATIEKIYTAAADSSYWPAALGAVEEVTGSIGAVVHIVPTNDGAITTLLGKSEGGQFLAEHVDEWARDYASVCPRLAAASRWPDAPYYVDYMLLSERQMELDAAYAWYRKHGLGYFIGSRLTHDSNVEIVWSLQRSCAQGHAQKADVELFELFKPHLANALGLGLQLGTLQSFNRLGSAIFEALPQAVFALDGQGAVLFANGRGRELLRAADGLSLEAGLLRTAYPNDQIDLNAMIRSATEPLEPSASRGTWAGVSRPSGRLPYAVFVAPLRVTGEDFLAAEAKVLVLVHDLSEQRCAHAEMLVSLYALTDTEARLASALSAGHSLESAATLLGMQPTTARTHLKHVFRKLGVNRQQDLVRLLTSLSSLTPLV